MDSAPGTAPRPQALEDPGLPPGARRPPGQEIGKWAIPRVFEFKPEDSTFWLVFPRTGPKCKAIIGAQ